MRYRTKTILICILIALSILMNVVVGVLTNWASEAIPDSWRFYLWRAWPFLCVLTVVLIGVGIWLFVLEQRVSRDAVEWNKEAMEDWELPHEHAAAVVAVAHLAAHQAPLQRPPQVEHFVGREKEVARLVDALCPGDLVSLCGPGGIGKTAIAAEAVWAMAPGDQPPDRFPDGVIFNSFYDNPNTVVALETIALAYGEAPRPTPTAAARRALANRQALLILDGAESAEDLAAVLKIRGNCGVLITTQVRHQVVGKRVDILPLPIAQAVELLRAWAGHRVTDDNSAQSICELVGGLPLAVRLAGRYLAQREEDAADYLVWLKQTPLEALDFGTRQHESVPVLLGKSVNQVSEPARSALTVVGTLALQAFRREAVAAALELSPTDVGRSLGELVDFGFLVRENSRYRVSHSLIHTYACERCSLESNELDRLARFYAELARKQLKGGVEGLRDMDQDRAHIMAALDHCVEQQRWVVALDLTWAVDQYLDLRGYWGERVKVLKWGLTAAQGAAQRRDEGGLLSNLGNTYAALAEYDLAFDSYRQALRIFREIEWQPGEARNLVNLATLLHLRGDHLAALSHYQNARSLLRKVGDDDGLAVILIQESAIMRDLGQSVRAIRPAKKALMLARKTGSRRLEGRSLGNLGNAYREADCIESAKDCYRQTLTIGQEIGDRQLECNAFLNLGGIEERMGKCEEAVLYLTQALNIAFEIGDRRSRAAALRSLGKCCLYRGEMREAIRLLQEALQVSRTIGDREGEAQTLCELGNTSMRQERLDAAFQFYEEALEIARDTDDRVIEGALLGNIARIQAMTGEPERALESHKKALAIAVKTHDRRGECREMADIGLALMALGQLEEAKAQWEGALNLAREIGFSSAEADSLANLGTCYRMLGQIERALKLHKQALGIHREIGDHLAEANDLGNLGNDYHRLGQPSRAVPCYEQALRIWQQVGNQVRQAMEMLGLAEAHAALDQRERAIASCEQALYILEELGDRRAEKARSLLSELKREHRLVD